LKIAAEVRGHPVFILSEGLNIEFFFASDASAIIEHTNRVIYLEVSLL
jgi:glucosamine 6-phosphate synthetase-like amidotransferase/phosphosugar isomerase protein